MDSKTLRGKVLRSAATHMLSETEESSNDHGRGNTNNAGTGGERGNSSAPIAIRIDYTSAYASLTPDETLAGLTVEVSGDNVPGNGPKHVLAMRIRTGGENVIGTSPSSGENVTETKSTYLPPISLSSGESYLVDLQWVREGAQQILWNQGAVFSTYSIVSAIAEVDAVDISESGLSASIVYKGAPAGTGVRIAVFSKDGNAFNEIGSATTEGLVPFVAFDTPQTSEALYITAQCVIPLESQGFSGGYAGPFGYGPQSPFEAIPMAAQTVTGLDYDGDVLSVEWSNFSNANGIVSPIGELEVWSGDDLIVSAESGASKAQVEVVLQGDQEFTLTVQPEASGYSNLPLRASIISAVPSISDVVLASAKVQAVVAENSEGYDVIGYLMSGAGILAGPVKAADGVLSFDYDATGQVGVFVTGKYQSADTITTGPLSAPAILLATSPTLLRGEMLLTTGDASNWSLNYAWDRLPDAPDDVIMYHVELLQGETVVESMDTTQLSVAMGVPVTSIDTTKNYQLRLSATGITNGISPSQSWQVLFAGAEINEVEITDDQLIAGWIAPAGVSAANELPLSYEIAVYDSNSAIQYVSEQFEGLHGSISMANVPSDIDPVVTVNTILGPNYLSVTTAATTAFTAAAIVESPEISPITTNPLTNKATLHWKAIEDASSYSILFSNGTTVDSITDTTYELPEATPVSGDVYFTVRAHGTSNDAAITGPFSDEVALPASTVNVSAVRYDGKLVTIEWGENDNALSYDVSIYQDGDQPSQEFNSITEETRLQTSFDANKEATYTVYVQAVLANGTGRSGVTRSVFTAGYFLSKQKSPMPAYIYQGLTEAMLGSSAEGADGLPNGSTIRLYFPELSSENGGMGENPINSGPFTLTPLVGGDNGEYMYSLDIEGTPDVWSFETGTQIRLDLQTSYVDFLKKLEDPAGDNTLPGATPLSINRMQSAIARFMPQTFAEQIYYSSGFSTLSTVGKGFIDLRPGMVMRVTISDYINIPQYDVPDWIDGYAGATVLEFPIGGYSAESDWRVGFDAFLSMLSEKGAIEVGPPDSNADSTQSGMADGADLYYDKFIQPFYRLYFPSGQIPNSIGTGSNSTQQNFTLVAAPSYTELLTTNVNPKNTSTAYFRGRSTIELLQQIEVNGTVQLVPIGATVGNVLDQLGQRPYASSKGLQQLRITRSLAGGVTNPDNSLALDENMEIRFDWDGYTSYALNNGLDIFSLPVLSGDVIVTR